MRLALTIILLVLLAPTAAEARWKALVAVPMPTPLYDTPAAAMAVDDDGRAALAYPDGTAATLGILAPGGRALALTPIPGVQQTAALAFAPDGSIVGLGATLTGESPGSEASRRGPCCARPTVIRWRPPTAPQLTAVAPQQHDDYALNGLAIDGASTAFFLAHRDATAASNGVDLVARVPVDGPASLRRLTSRRTVDAQPISLHASPGSAGATVVWNGGHTFRRMTMRAGRWHETGRRQAVPRDDYRQEVVQGPDGRLAVTFERGGHLWLRLEGRQPDHDLGPIDKGGAWTTAAGDDGTVAVALVHHARLTVRSLRTGRLGPPRVLGSSRAGVALVVDAGGGVHVAWTRPGRRVTVVAPAGQRTFPGVTLESLVASPRGATAVQVRAGDQIAVAVGTRG